MSLVEVKYSDEDGAGTDNPVVTRVDDLTGNGVTDKPWVFLQWKGTDACFDLNCRCGVLTHFDGDFAYVVQCGHCRRVYAMPSTIQLKEIT